MKNFLKLNWFKIVVVILLVLIYSRLGKIKENTFYTADIVDSNSTRIISSLEQIERSLENLRIDNNMR